MDKKKQKITGKDFLRIVIVIIILGLGVLIKCGII